MIQNQPVHMDNETANMKGSNEGSHEHEGIRRNFCKGSDHF